jgi:putative sterol carrier protein
MRGTDEGKNTIIIVSFRDECDEESIQEETDKRMDTNNSPLAEKENAALKFLNRAASVYKPHQGPKDIVLEIYFTDIQRAFQMVLGKESCTVLTEGFLPFDARAEAAYPVFEDMAKGRKSPAMELIKGHVKTKGDMRILKKLDEYFPGLETEK